MTLDKLESLENEKQNKQDNGLLTQVKFIVGAINSLFLEKINKDGDTMNGSLSFGTRARINSLSDYGSPVFMMDKAGGFYFGIGGKYKIGDSDLQNQVVRYGACTWNSWLDIDNNYKHLFDGEIYAKGETTKVVTREDLARAVRVVATMTPSLSSSPKSFSFPSGIDIDNYNFIVFLHSDGTDVNTYDNYTTMVPISYFKNRIVGIADTSSNSAYNYVVSFKYQSNTSIYISANEIVYDNNAVEVWLV